MVTVSKVRLVTARAEGNGLPRQEFAYNGYFLSKFIS